MQGDILTLNLPLTPNPDGINLAERRSVKSSHFDGRSATHCHVPECVGVVARTIYTLIAI